MTLRNLYLPSFLAATLTALTPLAYAADNASQINNWYTALERADTAALNNLLAKDAEIYLTDSGITQTRDAFLDSMADWALAIEGGALRYKLLSADSTTTVTEVCYDFSENDILMRESFTFDGEKIQRQEQQQLANKC